MLKNIVCGMGCVAFLTFNASAVWINEFHYDNASGDVGEFVEVAGVAGTDLAGWSIVLYNGNGGVTYKTEGLTGLIDDEGDGYGALEFNISGIQNGAPDGIALVNGGTVVEFLSYEGAFTASNGPANGMTSTDVGVSESSSTAIGQSLQLTGAFSPGFTWTGPAAESPGSLNAGQTFPPVQVSSVPDGGLSAVLLITGLGLVSAYRRRVQSH